MVPTVGSITWVLHFVKYCAIIRIVKYHNFTEFLTYDQISLVPIHVSSLEHRAEADTSVQFGPVRLAIPIVAAPMPDVSNGGMAKKLREVGSLGWVHRFQALDETAKEYLKGYQTTANPYVAVSVGLGDNHRVQWFYHQDNRVFCIDVANAASIMVEKTIKTLKSKYPDIFLVVGNVATPETYREVESWGADAIRVGIAGGSVCETRTETGIYSPMATAIYACNLAKTKSLLIADGGIRTPSDMCKALALGADVVMLGGALAGTREAPGEVLKIDGKLYKKLRGASSFSIQKESKGEDPEYNEGAETLVPYKGSVEKVINRFAAGLRSSMSYADARTLEEYRNNIRVIRCF
jgi:IMP dehydrogenase/GMP reductase